VELQGLVRGSAALRLAAGVPLLRADEQVFAAMMEGWADQQLARNLAVSTVVKGAATVRAFAAHADALPWAWDARMLDEWLGDLRGVRGLARLISSARRTLVKIGPWRKMNSPRRWS